LKKLALTMSKTDAKPTVVIEAAKPYAMKKDRQESASSAPAVDESQVTDPKKGTVVPEPAKFPLVPWYQPETMINMVINAVVAGILITSICGINLIDNSLVGNFLQSPFTLVGASQLIYHGFMDGPLRDSKTGEYLPVWNIALRGSVCWALTTGNLALAIFVHKNMGVYKFIMSASCWVSVGVYALFGMWFLAPVHFVVVMGTLLHVQIFAFYIIARASPIAMPYAVMVTNMSIVSLYGWSMRCHLDDTGTMFWGSIMTPLLSGFRRISFIQVIGSSPWGLKIIMLVSNIMNAMLTPDVKTILYSKMGMKLEIYDVNAMYMLDALQWGADVKFVITMPILLVTGMAWDLDTATSGAISNGTVWPLFKNHFGLVFGLYTLQLVLSELVVYSMKWASKYVNVNRTRNSKRESHMQIGVSSGKGQGGRYYYAQFREDAKYYHPWIALSLEATQVTFTNYSMEDLYLL